MKVKYLFNTGKVLPKDVYKEDKYNEASEFQVTVNNRVYCLWNHYHKKI